MMKYMKYNYKYMLFIFFFISIMAWILELSYSYIINDNLHSPGVLFGPWCPIYGITSLMLIVVIDEKEKRIHNFFKIFFVAMAIEYFSSFVSEKVFNRIIWDYSKFIFNINGRVCIQMSLIFALLGFLFIYHINPFMKKVYKKMGSETELINIEFLILFICDIILTIINR